MQTVTLGPLLLSVAALALLFGVLAGQAVASFMVRRGHGDMGGLLWWLLLTALGAARVSYVARWWSSYRAHPLDIINVRDGGFDLVAGLLALAAGVALLVWRKKRWRVNLPASVVVGVATWALILGAASRLDEATHQPMPSLVFDDIDGQVVSLDSLRGQPIVINLWATWCAPCRREMPVLVKAQQSRSDVRFVFADQGESPMQVRQYLRDNDLAPRHVLIDVYSQLSLHYGVRGYPTTLFLDESGELADMHVGELTHATLQDRLQRVLPTRESDGGSQSNSLLLSRGIPRPK